MQKKSTMTLRENDLDIYASIELKKTLMEKHAMGINQITLNFKNVERISTPALQVLISAKKTFEKIAYVSVNDDVKEEVLMLGLTL